MFEKDEQPGTSRENPTDHLREEILCSLAHWKAQYDLKGQELAWLTMRALFEHVRQYEGIEVRAEFTEKLARMSADTVEQILEVLRQDNASKSQVH